MLLAPVVAEVSAALRCVYALRPLTTLDTSDMSSAAPAASLSPSLAARAASITARFCLSCSHHEHSPVKVEALIWPASLLSALGLQNHAATTSCKVEDAAELQNAHANDMSSMALPSNFEATLKTRPGQVRTACFTQEACMPARSGLHSRVSMQAECDAEALVAAVLASLSRSRYLQTRLRSSRARLSRLAAASAAAGAMTVSSRSSRPSWYAKHAAWDTTTCGIHLLRGATSSIPGNEQPAGLCRNERLIENAEVSIRAATVLVEAEADLAPLVGLGE